MKSGMMGVIPSKILQDKSLSDGDKIMFAIITAHADGEGTCKEDEAYFASIRCVDERTIRSQIATLVQRGIILRSKSDDGFILKFPTEQYFASGNDIVASTAKQVLTYWNSVMGLELPYTSNFEKLIKRRLRKVSPEQLIRAIQGRIAFVKTNTWFDREENKAYKNKVDAILQSDEEVEKYMAYPIENPSILMPADPRLKQFKNSDGNQTVLE